LTGAAAPDMGAYEFGNWHMEVANTPRPGETVFFTVQGPAGVSFLGFGMLDGVGFAPPYGVLLAGLNGGIGLVVSFPVLVGTSTPVAVPNDPGLAGAVLGLQSLTFPTGNASVGNFGELYRLLVRP
jgi:hypothetical protein